MQKQQQENAALQHAIVEAVQSILAKHFQIQQQKMEEYIHNVKQSFQSSIQNLGTFKEKISTNIQQAKQKCTEFNYKTILSQGNLINALDSFIKVNEKIKFKLD
jgi:hypothetical protein